jgi:salicylate hydroxylase
MGRYLVAHNGRHSPILIIGGGIGGLSAALALQQAGLNATVLEQAPAFIEIGAGLQCGPNAMRRLHAWGLQADLARVAAFPKALRVRSAATGTVLGTLPLGASATAAYGAPYATLHRADLHDVLLQAARAAGISLQANYTLSHYTEHSGGVTVHANRIGVTQYFESTCLIGADGLRSAVRQHLLNDGAPPAAGQVVYRALVSQSELPVAQRSQDITAWLGPHLHVVAYPVRGGELLNVAAIVHGVLPEHSTVLESKGQASSWNQSVHTCAVYAALRGMCKPLNDLIHALPDWRAWNVYDRPPVARSQDMALGRVALLGDAAHPMRPYLAQGAGMAIEDAAALAAAFSNTSNCSGDTALALQTYAAARWQRNARVQARAQRNGEWFHATGLMRLACDAGIRLLGKQVLDVPWLYAG